MTAYDNVLFLQQKVHYKGWIRVDPLNLLVGLMLWEI